jgi:integrase
MRNVYTRHFKPALRRAGLDEGTRFHDLRHSAASTAIALGANVKTVQQMLGHSSATVTLDVYSHQFPGLAEQLREGLDAAYRSLEDGRNADQERTTSSSAVISLLSRTAENSQ